MPVRERPPMHEGIVESFSSLIIAYEVMETYTSTTETILWVSFVAYTNIIADKIRTCAHMLTQTCTHNCTPSFMVAVVC